MSEKNYFHATAMPDRDWWSALWPSPASIIDSLGVIQHQQNVIDLACGYGYFTSALAKQVTPGLVFGIDLDADMLNQAKESCQNSSNIQWVEGDAMHLSQLIELDVDCVLMANTFHGVPDQTALSREVAKVLVANGRFIIINWYPLPREETTVLGLPRGPSFELRMSPEQVQKVVEPAGYNFEKVVDLPPYHYAAIFSRP